MSRSCEEVVRALIKWLSTECEPNVDVAVVLDKIESLAGSDG